MRLPRLTLLLTALVSAGGVLVGCASMRGQLSPQELDQAIQQADALAANGQTGQAIALLDATMTLDPSAASPWIKKAQLHFQTGDYAAAIQSAEQAKSRDAGNQEARSIAIVSALRIAIGGLAELRGQQGMGDNAYAEAQRMTAVLKASLGTDVLVPAEQASASGLVPAPTAVVTEPRRKPAARSAQKPNKKPGAAAETPSTEPGNPFKDLN